MFFEPIYTGSEWVGDLVFGIAGVIYFVMWEIILDMWFTRAGGICTTEWMMGQGANLIWAICSRTCCRPPPTEEDDATESEHDEEQDKDV